MKVDGSELIEIHLVVLILGMSCCHQRVRQEGGEGGGGGRGAGAVSAGSGAERGPGSGVLTACHHVSSHLEQRQECCHFEIFLVNLALVITAGAHLGDVI